MVGDPPPRCPFCGASSKHFLPMPEVVARYRVERTPVGPGVTQLLSTPPLGLEHSAYLVELPHKRVLVDCPSSFDPSFGPVDDVYFTHHHFLGASNLYREEFGANIHLHAADAATSLSRPFPVDDQFEGDFADGSLEAWHLDGHTRGFTFYSFGPFLFVCDYAFVSGDGLRYNPYGPADRTAAGGRELARRVERRTAQSSYSHVLGHAGVAAFGWWWPRFQKLAGIDNV